MYTVETENYITKYNRKKSKKFGHECDIIEYINQKMNDEHLSSVLIPNTKFVITRIPTYNITNKCFRLTDLCGTWYGEFEYFDDLLEIVNHNR